MTNYPNIPPRIIIDTNLKQFQIIADKIQQILSNSVLYEICDLSRKQGYKLKNKGRDYLKNDIQGIYVTYLKSILNNELIDFYIGETNNELDQRLGRLIKQATGEQHITESHSGGQLLFDEFTRHGKKDIWEKNLKVRFIKLDEIKNVIGDTAFPMVDLTVENFQSFHFVKDFPDKEILRFFEQAMIDRLSPIANILGNSFFSNSPRLLKNCKNFNDLCNLVKNENNQSILKEKKVA